MQCILSQNCANFINVRTQFVQKIKKDYKTVTNMKYLLTSNVLVVIMLTRGEEKNGFLTERS